MINGPSEIAAQTACAVEGGNSFTTDALIQRALDAAHDPALGLDGSICKRDVVEWLEKLGNDPGYGSIAQGDFLHARDKFEREFGGK